MHGMTTIVLAPYKYVTTIVLDLLCTAEELEGTRPANYPHENFNVKF